MNTIFQGEFERTEFSDEIHGILGRVLILSTRYDSHCKALATIYNYKYQVLFSSLLPDSERNEFYGKLSSDFRNLNRAIQSLPIYRDNDISGILDKSRCSRNSLIHGATLGYEGLFDLVDKKKFEGMLNNVEILLRDLIKGDVIISACLSIHNKEPISPSFFEKCYEDKIVNWVMGRFET